MALHCSFGMAAHRCVTVAAGVTGGATQKHVSCHFARLSQRHLPLLRAILSSQAPAPPLALHSVLNSKRRKEAALEKSLAEEKRKEAELERLLQ
jgi:hypothetical protein